jgi:hypothetical protein
MAKKKQPPAASSPPPPAAPVDNRLSNALRPTADRAESIARLVRMFWCLEYRKREARLTGMASSYGSGWMLQWDGGISTKSGHKHAAIWPRVAAYCLANRIDPVRLVRATMESFPPDPAFRATPNSLLSERAIAAYQAFSLDEPDRLSVELKSCEAEAWMHVRTRVVYRGLDQARALLQVLRDETLGLTPLYRHCALVRAGHADEAEHYSDRAFLAYLLAARSYDIAWGDAIPASFRERAAVYLPGRAPECP